MFKIQLENNEFYKSKSGRVQHYRSTEKASAKITKLGDIAVGATVVESKARTTEIDNPEEIVPETKVEKVSKKKTSAKAKNPEVIVTDPGEFVTDAETAKGTIGKTKKTKKNEKT